MVNEYRIWSEYLKFIVEWAEEHKDIEHYRSSPPCFDEWYDNELHKLGVDL